METLGEAIRYLNSSDFHKRLRIGFLVRDFYVFGNHLYKTFVDLFNLNSKVSQKNDFEKLNWPE